MPDFVDAIIIVDDKSTDDTVIVVTELKLNAKIVLIQYENNLLGGALASGYEYLRDNDYDIVVDGWRWTDGLTKSILILS